jgi:hypothetical protein
MGQQTVSQECLFYECRLDDWVSVDHLLQKIGDVLELKDLRRELAPFYSPWVSGKIYPSANPTRIS